MPWASLLLSTLAKCHHWQNINFSKNHESKGIWWILFQVSRLTDTKKMGGRGTDCPGHLLPQAVITISFFPPGYFRMLDSACISFNLLSQLLCYIQVGCKTLRRKSSCLNPFFESPQCLAGMLLHVQEDTIHIASSCRSWNLNFELLAPNSKFTQQHSLFLH